MVTFVLNFYEERKSARTLLHVMILCINIIFFQSTFQRAITACASSILSLYPRFRCFFKGQVCIYILWIEFKYLFSSNIDQLANKYKHFAGLPKELNRTREAIAGSEDNKVSTCCLPFIILNILVRALFALKSSSKIHFSTGDGRLG